MKKILLLILVVVLFTACKREAESIENEYFTIIHDIVPAFNEYIDKSDDALKQLRADLLEKKKDFDINQAIKDIEKVKNDAVKKIEEKKNNFQNKLTKDYAEIKIQYINTVTEYSVNMLKNFEKEKNKTSEVFFEHIKKAVKSSEDNVTNIINEDKNLLQKISNIIEK